MSNGRLPTGEVPASKAGREKRIAGRLLFRPNHTPQLTRLSSLVAQNFLPVDDRKNRRQSPIRSVASSTPFTNRRDIREGIYLAR